MKKLMIAAAVAAMIGGAYAACSDLPTNSGCTDEDCRDCNDVKQTLVYQWQFKGKTGAGAVVSETTTVTGGSCTDGGSTVACEVVRVPGSLAIVAYSYLCEAECNAFEPAGQNMLVTPFKAQYYGTKPLKSLVAPYRNKNFIKNIAVAHVIGKKANQYELAGTAEFVFDDSDIGQKYSLFFAGFGSYDQKKLRVNSVSGNFAGFQAPPRYAKTACGQRCAPADWWKCCPLSFAGAPLDDSVAYGSWSVKFNSSATKKFDTAANTYWVK